MTHSHRFAASAFTALAASLLSLSAALAVPPDSRAAAESGHAMLAQAREMRAGGEAGYGDRFRHAASALARAGLQAAAVEAVDELLIEPESEFDRFTAMRMKAQYLLAMGREAEACTAASEVLALADAQPDLKRFNASYLTAIYTASRCRSLASDTAGELALVERIVATDRSRFDEDVVASALIRKASLLEKSGDRLGAVEAVQSLLDTFPTWGASDGRRLDVELGQLKRRYPDPLAPELAAGLAVIWNAAENRSQMGILHVGHELRRALASASDTAGAVTIAREMVDLLDARKADWIAAADGSPRTEANIQQFESEELEYLAWSAPDGLQWHTAWAIGRLIDREARPDRRQALFIRLLEVAGSP